MMINIKHIKKVFRSSGIYIGTSIFNHAASFLLIPLLTRVLAPVSYGILATFQAIYPFSQSFVDMGSTTAVSRRYFEAEDKHGDFKHYVFHALLIKGIFFIILTALFFFFRAWISKNFMFPGWLIILICVLSFASSLIDTALKIVIVQKKAYTYSILQSTRTILNIGISLLFVVAAGMNWRGRILGITITEILFMFVCVIFLLKNRLLAFSIRSDYFKEMLKIGMPMFAYGIGWWVICLTDRFFINVMVGVSSTGIYSVGYSLASVIEFIAGGVGFAVMPFLFEKFKNPTQAQKILIVKYAYLYFIALFFITIAWILLSPYVVRIFVGRDFTGALPYVPLISLAYFSNAMFRIFSLFLIYAKKTYYLTYSVIVAAITNLILNYVLIRANGVMGAAQSTFISYTINALLVWYFAQKVYPMPWFNLMQVKT